MIDDVIRSIQSNLDTPPNLYHPSIRQMIQQRWTNTETIRTYQNRRYINPSNLL